MSRSICEAERVENIVIDNVFVWMARVGVVRRLRCFPHSFLLVMCLSMKFMTCSFDFHEPSEISLELSSSHAVAFFMDSLMQAVVEWWAQVNLFYIYSTSFSLLVSISTWKFLNNPHKAQERSRRDSDDDVVCMEYNNHWLFIVFTW